MSSTFRMEILSGWYAPIILALLTNSLISVWLARQRMMALPVSLSMPATVDDNQQYRH